MKEELAIRAVKLFPKLFPDAWKHDKCLSGGALGVFWCKKCYMSADDLPKRGDFPDLDPLHAVPMDGCTIPDPIDINWDNAMKLVRTAGIPVVRQLWIIWTNSHYHRKHNLLRWIVFHATPADYILAACKAREKENE